MLHNTYTHPPNMPSSSRPTCAAAAAAASRWRQELLVCLWAFFRFLFKNGVIIIVKMTVCDSLTTHILDFYLVQNV